VLKHRFIVFLILITLLMASHPAEAHARKYNAVYRDKTASLVVHSESGVILYQENADKPRYPASLTKLMTLYLTFDAIKEKKLNFNTQLVASANAASQPRMSLGLKKNERLPVATAVDSLVVLSANDAAVVLAEAIGGSEWQFAQMMNKKAKALGMTNTHFENASGLFDPKQVTTAKDMAKLMMALERDFPLYYSRLGKTRFAFRGHNYHTHNHVLARYKGAVAGKTGYVSASGFNLTTAAKRAGEKLVAVVMGGKSAPSRDRKMVALLDKSFKKLKDKSVSRAIKANLSSSSEKTPGDSALLGSPSDEPVASAVDATPMELASTTPAKRTNWSVSMGAFRQEEEAVSAVASAMDMAPDQLASSQITFASREKSRGREHWATFHNLSEQQAKKACQLLGLVNTPCQIASY
jgi:D-alanyl-D-alanine carboxypeptidase